MSRSIHTEIQRAHLQRAQQLLRETDLSIVEVAKASGFRSPSYLAAVLRTTLGMTPAKYRTHVRSR